MKITEHTTTVKKRQTMECYYENLEKKQQKQQHYFTIFLYMTVLVFGLASITIVAKFAVQLGLFGTIAASICAIGWWGAYTLIVVQETLKTN